MTLFVALEVMKGIQEHVRQAYPEEGCGLLIGDIPADFGVPGSDVRASDFRPLKNTANPQRKNDRYELAPQAWAAVEKEFLGKPQGIVGIYHSHPDAPAWPSPFDLQRSWPAYAYLIIATTEAGTGDARVWRRSEDGRSFIEGKTEVL
ncbi:MAG TPA: M67 family metallopeptidase [Elusimicrobiota bacterium]|nr:M67 family metallopeptidase [Elusimicrobiota bacterium]